MDEHRGPAFALAETRAGPRVVPGSGQGVDQFGTSGQPTRHVVAHVEHHLGLGGFAGQQVVEGGHSVGLGRRYLQDPADVVEATRADPPGGPLEGVKGREQKVTTLPGPLPTGVDEAF